MTTQRKVFDLMGEAGMQVKKVAGMEPNTYVLAGQIGDALEAEYPRTDEGLIPKGAYKKVAEEITMVVAEILQSWLDAGSERDVTLEELGPVIEEHCLSWSADHPDAEGPWADPVD